MSQKKQEKVRPKEQDESARPDQEITEKGEEIEERLDALDEMIEEALGEDEENAELRAQEFVDGFKQKGGQ